MHDHQNTSWLIGTKLMKSEKLLKEPLSESNLKTFRKWQNITESSQIDHELQKKEENTIFSNKEYMKL